MNGVQREIWLVPFPFSDLSGQKVRPVLVVSHNNFNSSSDDVIVCAITSNLTKEKYTLLISPETLLSGELHDLCVVKVDTIFKINKKLLLKKIGQVQVTFLAQMKEKLFSLF